MKHEVQRARIASATYPDCAVDIRVHTDMEIPALVFTCGATTMQTYPTAEELRAIAAAAVAAAESLEAAQ